MVRSRNRKISHAVPEKQHCPTMDEQFYAMRKCHNIHNDDDLESENAYGPDRSSIILPTNPLHWSVVRPWQYKRETTSSIRLMSSTNYHGTYAISIAAIVDVVVNDEDDDNDQHGHQNFGLVVDITPLDTTTTVPTTLHSDGGNTVVSMVPNVGDMHVDLAVDAA